jgi:hypothetical protein
MNRLTEFVYIYAILIVTLRGIQPARLDKIWLLARRPPSNNSCSNFNRATSTCALSSFHHQHHQLTCNHASLHSRQPSRARRCVHQAAGQLRAFRFLDLFARPASRNFPRRRRCACSDGDQKTLARKLRKKEVHNLINVIELS